MHWFTQQPATRRYITETRERPVRLRQCVHQHMVPTSRDASNEQAVQDLPKGLIHRDRARLATWWLCTNRRLQRTATGREQRSERDLLQILPKLLQYLHEAALILDPLNLPIFSGTRARLCRLRHILQFRNLRVSLMQRCLVIVHHRNQQCSEGDGFGHVCRIAVGGSDRVDFIGGHTGVQPLVQLTPCATGLRLQGLQLIAQ
mmetsp:Transcript_6619/g.12500  ORF Transcript_6619/g.12500 Transcript_6619/m.12500 type:complete len:203 (-) Transcript_6619:1099-1707(-)